jgi:Domain of unknown function (DUF4124)
MKKATLLLIAATLGATFALPASAQWKWRDRNGVVQYSDTPPPSGIPAQDVLQKPSPSQRTLVAPPAAASGPAAAQAAASAPLAPKGADPELEARRRKQEQDKADKGKAEERAQAEKVAVAKADNCSRARAHMRTLEEGIRMVRTNASGEREVLDDKARAEEKSRAREVIAADCK